MIFGRVEAVATPAGGEWLHLRVYLESGRGLRTIRDEEVPRLLSTTRVEDFAWQADQYAQETIANELAAEGWEVIGGGEVPPIEDGALPRSATYAVRRIAEVTG
jgi:hypothetical protein